MATRPFNILSGWYTLIQEASSTPSDVPMMISIPAIRVTSTKEDVSSLSDEYTSPPLFSRVDHAGATSCTLWLLDPRLEVHDLHVSAIQGMLRAQYSEEAWWSEEVHAREGARTVNKSVDVFKEEVRRKIVFNSDSPSLQEAYPIWNAWEDGQTWGRSNVWGWKIFSTFFMRKPIRRWPVLFLLLLRTPPSIS